MSRTFEINAIEDATQLDRVLSTPTDALVNSMRTLEGDILILGAGGKMGPTLGVMARRATDAAGADRRIAAVSRFGNTDTEAFLRENGVKTIRCDLLDEEQLAKLPDARNIVFMAGMKFGTTGQESTTWTFNTVLPGMVARRFPGARFIVFSTGNVYPLTPAEQGGSLETDTPAPIGEYAASCLGRERIFAYYATALKSPTVMIRLNYANELRYGVLVDLARKIWEGRPVDVTMGYVNVIWQGDACAMILRAFEHAAVPSTILNVVGPETLRVRDLAEQFGRLMDKPVRFTGHEAPDALLSNGERGYECLGRPETDYRQMLRWIATWVMHDGDSLAKPTHFECRDGRF